MNKEVGKYVIVCVAFLCATIWLQGRGTISEVTRKTYEFKHGIESFLYG